MHTPLKNHRIPLLKDYFSEGEGVGGQREVRRWEVGGGRWEESDRGGVGIISRAPPVSVFCLILGAVCVCVCATACVCVFRS